MVIGGTFLLQRWQCVGEEEKWRTVALPPPPLLSAESENDFWRGAMICVCERERGGKRRRVAAADASSTTTAATEAAPKTEASDLSTMALSHSGDLRERTKMSQQINNKQQENKVG